jgi:hypothetical protein
VRPTHPRFVPLLILAWALLAGCSKDVERIVANERLLRGQDVIGTTDRAVFDADRDTYVGVGQRNFGNTLLVGEDGAYQAVSHLRVVAWNVPDTSVVIDSLYFAIANDSSFVRGTSTFTIELADSSGGLGFPTSSATYGLGTLRIDLPGGVIDSMRSWAARPLTAPTFELRAPLATGVAGFQAGAGAFVVVYHLKAAPTTSLTAKSLALIDSYTRSPLTPLPTGAETALLMGGRYETMVAMRARVPAVPAGYSLNEAAWVIHLDGVEDALEDNGFVPGKTYLDVDVFRIGASWAESASDTLGLSVGGAIPAIRFQRMDPATDTTLVVPIPLAWMRGWAADTTTNNGILIAFTRWREAKETVKGTVYAPIGPDISSAIRVRSRETANPPQLRLSWTSPPPGRI